ncbi:MAG: hypothetical protein E7I48_09995 [Clostridium celatum]|nr:hypothetical protein [Clostridium celatum]
MPSYLCDYVSIIIPSMYDFACIYFNVFVNNTNEVINMKDRMTVNIDADLKKYAKKTAVDLDLDLGQFVEFLINEYKKNSPTN